MVGVECEWCGGSLSITYPGPGMLCIPACRLAAWAVIGIGLAACMRLAGVSTRARCNLRYPGLLE